MPQVFLSYSSTDERLAQELRDAMEHQGFKVWSDLALKPGDLWANKIGSALRSADSFVFLVGREEPESTWASIELGQALASGKKVVPVVTEPNAHVPTMLQGFQYLDLSDHESLDSAISHLIEVLREPSTGIAQGEGIRFIEEASSNLAHEQEAHERLLHERTASVARLQLAFALIAVIVSGVALGLSGGGMGSDVGASIFAGLSASFAALVGFKFGRREGQHQDE